jgi:hypothetical protein
LGRLSDGLLVLVIDVNARRQRYIYMIQQILNAILTIASVMAVYNVKHARQVTRNVRTQPSAVERQKISKDCPSQPTETGSNAAEVTGGCAK